MTKLSTILDQIDAGAMLLPEFQRGYVWNRDQVRGLMRSLYLGYPVGALLVWETEGGNQAVRGSESTAGPKQLLLDGQQRVTTLYGIVRGKAPSFFEGDPAAFTGLRFNVETEAFQFHAPVKMKDDPRWIDVTALFVDGLGPSVGPLHGHPETAPRFAEYINRLQKLLNIGEKPFHIEQITGADKTVDIVVDIFNRVNSGGTKLSKGDLALARICSEWGDARPTMRRNLDRWAEQGFRFSADWLLRNTNAVATGRAPFSALEDVTAVDFQDALNSSMDHIDHVLYLLRSRLGIDHDRVLSGRYAIPVLTRLLSHRGGRFAGGEEADKALYWFVHAALRGRFAGSTETFLAKDLETVDNSGIDGVIASLSRSRKGNMRIDAQDFEGVGRGARSYPLLYLLTRVRQGRDLVTSNVLGSESSTIEVHELFPKAQLAKHGYSRAEVNAIANFAFLGPSSEMHLSSADPAAYLRTLDAGSLRSQWIPEDQDLWKIENYSEFLAARRELLATAATGLMDDLLSGSMPWNQDLQPVEVIDELPESGAREAQLASLLEEFAELGFAVPDRDTEIPDPDTGRRLAVAELYWDRGLQPGQGDPIVLELDPEDADLPRLAEIGHTVFTTVDALRGYVHRLGEDAAGDVPEPPIESLVDPLPADGEFEKALYGLIESCRTELGYNAQNMRELIYQYGPTDAVRRILNSRTVSDGYVRLWEAGRLDLAVETVVVDRRFAAMFSPEERAVAQGRLNRTTDGARLSTPAPVTEPVDPEQAQLVRRLAQHLRTVRAAAQDNEFVDLPLAEKLHARLGAAIERWPGYDAEQRGLLSGAVSHLVRIDDDEDDLRSPVGFDDDAEVVEEALRRISG